MKLREIGVMLRSATEATDETPAGKLFATMLGAFAQFDNDTRAERTLTGMKATLDKGRWPWRGPTGYLNGRQNEPSLVPDPVRAPLIAKLFELIGSGQLRKSKALEHVTALGLRSPTVKPLTQETIRKMLTNPLYCGRMEVAKWGKSVQGDFEPLVSEGLFDQVQLILAGRVVTTAPHVRSNPSFPLSGTLLCTVCSLHVTASGSRGKAGKVYPFYHCVRGKDHIRVRAETVHQAFVELLDKLTPTPERMDALTAIFRHVWEDRNAVSALESEVLESELKRLNGRKAAILEQMAAGRLGGDDFSSLFDPLKIEIAGVQDRLSNALSNELDVDTALPYLEHCLWNTSMLWQTNDQAEKNRLQKMIFPKGIRWDGIAFGTPVTHSFFRMLADTSASNEVLVAP